MITINRPIEIIEKRGKPIFIGCKTCKTYSKFLQSLIGQLTKRNEIQSRMIVELCLEKFYEFYPNEREGIQFNDETLNYKINSSKIRRFDWKSVFNRSIGTEIEERYYKNNINVDDAVNDLQKDQRVIDFIEKHKLEKDKILENIKTSVHSRYSDCIKFGDKK